MLISLVFQDVSVSAFCLSRHPTASQRHAGGRFDFECRSSKTKLGSFLTRQRFGILLLRTTLQGTITYPLPVGIFESMVFLLPRWDMLVSSRVRAKYLKIGGLPQKEAGLFPNLPPFFRVEVLALGSVDRYRSRRKVLVLPFWPFVFATCEHNLRYQQAKIIIDVYVWYVCCFWRVLLLRHRFEGCGSNNQVRKL